MVWAALAGAALGYGMNAYGERKGAKAMEGAARDALARDQRANARRGALLGTYINDLSANGPGRMEEGYAADQTRTIDAAAGTQAVGAGAQALGVQPGARVRPDARRAVTGRLGAKEARLGRSMLQLQRLDSGLSQIERDREMQHMVDPSLMEDAAREGRGYRQLGTLISGGASAYSNYQNAQKFQR